MRPGVRVGVDVGSVRVGVARSDPHGILATPVTTLARANAAEPVAADADLAALVALVRSEEVLEVIVGLPRSLSGTEGSSAVAARQYAAVLARGVAPVAVRLIDERLTTVDATAPSARAGSLVDAHGGSSTRWLPSSSSKRPSTRSGVRDGHQASWWFRSGASRGKDGNDDDRPAGACLVR